MNTNKDSHKLGLNRTGVMTSPIDSRELAEGARSYTIPPEGSDADLGENRIAYMKEAGDGLGSVPMPTTLKGALSGVKENLKFGTHILIDKLGERLAFERAGTRLYDALISKHKGSADQAKLPPIETLERFRAEELSHFHLLVSVVKDLGADPTAVTPAADVAGVASMGIMQVITDARTTFAQSLDAILIAELTDNDGWDLLISITEKAGLDEITEQFRTAREEEAVHLATIREWLMALNLGKDADLSEGLATYGLRKGSTESGEDRLQSQ